MTISIYWYNILEGGSKLIDIEEILTASSSQKYFQIIAVIMSEDNNEVTNEASSTSSCASCGITENDDIKLKNCAACYLVRYCSVQCQREHRSKHKRACRKRAAELHDEILFKQPEGSHMGDCPICILPLPLGQNRVMGCCSNLICSGCYYTNQKREIEQRLDPKCPFCRQLLPRSNEEADRNQRKRAEANDPVAVREVGGQWSVPQKGVLQRCMWILVKSSRIRWCTSALSFSI